MKKIILMGLLIFSSFVMSAEKNAVPGEYIITFEKEVTQIKMQEILQTLEIRPLGMNQYLVKYQKDPGLEALVKQGAKSFKVQPNFIYKAKTKKKLIR